MDNNKTTGKIDFKIIGIDGKVRDEWSVDNLTMNVAFAVYSGLAGDIGTKTPFTDLALGTSSSSVSAGQTGLGVEITTGGLERTTATPTQITTTQTDDTLQLYNEFISTGSFTIEEIGYFNADGVMGGRALTTTKTIVSGEKIQTTYQIKFS